MFYETNQGTAAINAQSIINRWIELKVTGLKSIALISNELHASEYSVNTAFPVRADRYMLIYIRHLKSTYLCTIQTPCGGGGGDGILSACRWWRVLKGGGRGGVMLAIVGVRDIIKH